MEQFQVGVSLRLSGGELVQEQLTGTFSGAIYSQENLFMEQF